MSRTVPLAKISIRLSLLAVIEAPQTKCNMAVSTGDPSIFIPPKEEHSFSRWEEQDGPAGSYYSSSITYVFLIMVKKVLHAATSIERENTTDLLTVGQASAIPLYFNKDFEIPDTKVLSVITLWSATSRPSYELNQIWEQNQITLLHLRNVYLGL
jgi:hypothetical protein